MKKQWTHIHDSVLEEMRRRYRFSAAGLKHPFPQRPWRLLGLLKFDGDAYCSDRFARALFLKTLFPGTVARSLLLCPRAEYNFPVLSNETIVAGGKVLFLVDVQQVFTSPSRSTGALFDDLKAIRSGYEDLLDEPAPVRGEIARGFSPAAVYVRLSTDRYERASELLRRYLLRYLDAFDEAQPVDAEQLAGARQAFDEYADMVIEHDPAMRFLARMFGADSARERAYDMFFGK